MSPAIHSGDGVRHGAVIPDYPPPFKYPVPGYQESIRNALWSIEVGMGGRVDWCASFGARDALVAIGCAAAVHGPRFGAKSKRRVA